MMRRHAISIVALVVLAPIGAAVVNSCDNLEYSSQSSLFGGPTWHCAITSTGDTTDKIHIEYSASDFERLTGEQLEQDSASITVDGESVTNHVTYDFQVKDSASGNVFPRDIYDFIGVKGKLGGLYDSPTYQEKLNWVRSNWYDFDYDGQYEWYERADFWTSAKYLYCVDLNKKYGIAANIVDPYVHVAARFAVTVNGQTESTTISNNYDPDESASSGEVQRELGDLGLLRLRGNLRSGATVNQPSNYKVLALHDNSFEQNWRLINEGRYTDYPNYISSELESDLQAWADPTNSYTRSDLEAETTRVASAVQDAYNTWDSPFART